MRKSTATSFSSRFPRALAYLAVVFALSFAIFGTAHAADVVFDEDTTVTVNGSDYVLLADSEATSMEVGATTVTVTVPSGSTFTFQSLDRHVLNNNAGIAQTCTSSDNRLSITGLKSDVVITPDSSTLCTGDPAPSPSPASSPTGSVSQQVENLIAMGSYQQAWNLMERWPHLFTEEDRQLVAEKLQGAKLPQEESLELTREQLLQQIRELQLKVIELSNQLVRLLLQQISAAQEI